MKKSTSLISRIDDAINPIVVKELRQAVQSKFMATILMIFLGISIITLGIFLMTLNKFSNFDAGRWAIMFFQGILTVTCLLFVPIYTAIRLGSERSDINTDLMFITTIPARKIVFGKLLASAIITLVIYAACMPFMALTFLLRGVDLPTIVLVLVVDYLCVIGMIQLGIFAACLASTRLLQVLFALLLLGCLLVVIVWSISASAGIVLSGVASQMNKWEFWAIGLTIVSMCALGAGLLFFWSVALIKPISSNRALPVRIYISIMWLISGLIMGGWAIAGNDKEILCIWATIVLILSGLCLAISISEREQWGSRILRTVPKNRFLRLGAFILFSGSAGGIVWICLMLGLTVGALYLWNISGFSISVLTQKDFDIIIGIGLYVFSYAISALLIQRYILKNFIKPQFTWVVLLLLLAIGFLTPPLITFLLTRSHSYFNDSWWWLLSPLAFESKKELDEVLIFVGSWAGVVGLLAIPRFIRQLKNFKPLAEVVK